MTGLQDEDAPALQARLVALRRTLHTHPEVGLDVPFAQSLIVRELTELGLEVRRGRALSSVVGVVRGTYPGPSILLRAELDALPLTETAQVPYRSVEPGQMHACGHDVNAAMLVGAARMLAADRDRLHGDVVLMFQPGEEGWRGGQIMVEEGVLDASGTRVSAAYALHAVSAGTEHGVFTSRAGTICASSDRFSIRLLGRGGHASAPHLAADPIQAAAATVLALAGAVSRGTSPFDGAVLSVGSIHGGHAPNVIPDTVDLAGTLRCLDPHSRATLLDTLSVVCEGTAAAYGVRAEVTKTPIYPLSVNTDVSVNRVAQVVTELLGPARWEAMANPLTGSEDFGYVLQQVPGAIIFVGATPPGADPASAPYNHAADAVFDDGILLDGARVLAEVAWADLAGSSPRAPQ